MVYRPVPRSEIFEALIHIRELHRKVKPSNERDALASDRREAILKDLLSNLPRTSEHPTLKSVLEIADTCLMTLEGAHRLFGYNLDKLREYDLRLNGGRTHIIESYPFARDMLIDLPSQLAAAQSFETDALLKDLVPEWQSDISIRQLENDGWDLPGAFYIHIGTEDSLGSSIPPGATALVEPISDHEKLLPNPRRIYLLQFGNGYRCSHCVVSRGKLRLFSTTKTYLGREEFLYPRSVRVVGRVRMFAVGLPIPEFSQLRSLPSSDITAPLILPWEHASRDRLFVTKYRRFRRSKEEEEHLQDFLREELNAKLGPRSLRRYRRPPSPQPHVNSLIQLAVEHLARYTDAVRAGGFSVSDRRRFSLDTLLRAKSLEEAKEIHQRVHLPAPSDVWGARRGEFGEWPTLLSMKFPRLRNLENRIVRLAQGSVIHGLAPSISPGSWLLLEEISSISDIRGNGEKTGWSRPIYLFRRGLEMICGYLDREGDQFALLEDTVGGIKGTFGASEFHNLRRVTGIAAPV